MNDENNDLPNEDVPQPGGLDPNGEVMNHNFNRIRYSSAHGYYTKETGPIPEIRTIWIHDLEVLAMPIWNREAKDYSLMIKAGSKKPVKFWLWQACEKFEVYFVPHKKKYDRAPEVGSI